MEPEPTRIGPRIVAVEDEPDFRTVLEQWLSAGYELILLSQGQGLLEEIGQLQPDAVLLDIGLPGLDGVTLCRRLRENPQTAATPVLMLSGMTDEETLSRAREAGASGMLAKPVERAELRARINDLLEHRTPRLRAA
ncbi:MAG TPA: response regulator transcription factor [Elusimicrobiota bacterium]|nr:response regulator transcription factor [Elusimicrobiota bacterium]